MENDQIFSEVKTNNKTFEPENTIVKTRYKQQGNDIYSDSINITSIALEAK